MEQIKVFDDKFKLLVEGDVEFVYFENPAVTEKQSPDKDKSQSDNPQLACSYCGVHFSDVAKQREHYKLDWHRYNLKQDLLGRVAVTEDEFNQKTDDISSISGSESDEKEDSLDAVAAAQGKIFIKNDKNTVFSLYKSLLFDRKEAIANDLLLPRLNILVDNKKWCILMLGGGHFAGAVFDGTVPVLHKTFHCYTVRAGQGGAQGSRDSKSGGSQPKSAGASLRRYNEQALVQHVRDILEAWREDISACALIIYRASGPYNRNVLFDGKPPLLDRSDPRLRTVPFSTRRATFTEVKRVHEVLSTILIYENVEKATQSFAKYIEIDSRRSKIKSSNITRDKSREFLQRPLPVKTQTSSSSEEDSVLLDNFDRLNVQGQELNTHDHEVSFEESLQPFGDSLTPEQRIRKKKVPKKSKNRKMREREEQRKKNLCELVGQGKLEELKVLLQKYLEESPADDQKHTKDGFVNEVLDDDENTLLHLAAKFEQGEFVTFLLENDANPCLKNSKQQTPYVCTQNKAIRELFKTYAQDNPETYNYNKAQIPVSKLTPEELAEKKRAQKKIKREKEKEKRKENEIKKKEEQEKERFLKLSDREKRALAAERRIVNLSGAVITRCFNCATDITGKVPFEYLENKFCSVGCVKEHRTKNPPALS